MPTSAVTPASTAARRVLAGSFALTWFVFPGFGLIDLSVTWDPGWPQVLEAGWGLYMALFVGVPFAVVAVRGRPCLQPAVAQLAVAGALLVLSAPVAGEGGLVLWALVIAFEAVVIAGLPSGRPSAVIIDGVHPLLVPLALGAVPWTAYALRMWDLNRQDLSDSDITVGIDHYSVQGAFGLACLALVAVAALWPRGRLLMGASAGLAAVYLGIVSFAWHPTPGSFSRTWSVLCASWGLLVVVLSLLPSPRASRSER